MEALLTMMSRAKIQFINYTEANVYPNLVILHHKLKNFISNHRQDWLQHNEQNNSYLMSAKRISNWNSESRLGLKRRRSNPNLVFSSFDGGVGDSFLRAISEVIFRAKFDRILTRDEKVSQFLQ